MHMEKVIDSCIPFMIMINYYFTLINIFLFVLFSANYKNVVKAFFIQFLFLEEYL